ncbi:DUF3019 domain-containing protein [Marinomonas algicola]|uniref:DUF3019 domain-containing protein n=1 Tax=Marinomonas algicola TaxID=2773454 RepID=UPI00174868DB|nr:DUF3019 domain-containing protein [Marinomonas algicola]
MTTNLSMFVTISSLFLSLISLPIFAEEQALFFKVEPNRCIALRKGQTCYQSLTFRWKVSDIGEYCLFQQPRPQPLVCWRDKGIGSYKKEVQLDRSTVYQIRRKGNGDVVFETKIKVAWVYKNDRKNYSEWRLF